MHRANVEKPDRPNDLAVRCTNCLFMTFLARFFTMQTVSKHLIRRDIGGWLRTALGAPHERLLLVWVTAP